MRVKRLVVFVSGVILLTGIFYAGVIAVASWRQGYSWTEMDWNQDGSTSIVEFLQAGNIGKRPTGAGVKRCTEFFSFKDGLPVKIICPRGKIACPIKSFAIQDLVE